MRPSLLEEVVNKGDLAALDELIAPDYVSHAVGVPETGHVRCAYGLQRGSSVQGGGTPGVRCGMETGETRRGREDEGPFTLTTFLLRGRTSKSHLSSYSPCVC